MKKLMWEIVLVVFVIIAVLTTTCMLSKNDYNVMQFGNKIWLLANKEMEDYPNNSLLIIKEDQRNVKLNDEVFYYYENNDNNSVKYGKITAINNNSYTIEGEEIEKNMIISSKENASKISVLGPIISILTSRYGYLLLIILPILAAFIYQVALIIKELNKEPEETKKNKKKKIK